MSIHPRKLISAFLFLFAVGNAQAAEEPALLGPSLVGIDHIPTVVADLEEATAFYKRLGFSIKPGRFHENGLRNSHVKFKDGSGVELICPPSRSTDDLTRAYSDLLQDGEGPAYISFHARDTEALTTALGKANMQFKDDSGLLTLSEPGLGFIFFVKDNRSPTDKPEHFAHPNTAVAMTEVWLALDAPSRASLRKLLLALGAVEKNETALVPTEARAEVFIVQNGRVVVVSDAHQSQNKRKIIGVKFRVQSLRAAEQFWGTANTSVPPSAAHGLWLRFGELP
ncbi:MAG TPA: VOC family protein [Pseudoxanthomonas sp.]